MAAVRYLKFSKLGVFVTCPSVSMPFRFLLQNFAEIGQAVDELSTKKAIFNMAAVRHLELKK